MSAVVIRVLLRYALPSLLVFALTWFGKSYVGDILDRANGYDKAKQALIVAEKKHEVEIENIKESFAAVKESAEQAEVRREYWRQSYYEVKNEYSEYVKNWGRASYPADID